MTLGGLELDFSTLSQYRQRLWEGFLMTVMISVANLIVSLVIGSLTANIGQNSRILIISYFCRAYVQIISGNRYWSRFIFLLYHWYRLGCGQSLSGRRGDLIDFEGAYISEIIRGAWQVLTVSNMGIGQVDRVDTSQDPPAGDHSNIDGADSAGSGWSVCLDYQGFFLIISDRGHRTDANSPGNFGR